MVREMVYATVWGSVQKSMQGWYMSEANALQSFRGWDTPQPGALYRSLGMVYVGALKSSREWNTPQAGALQYSGPRLIYATRRCSTVVQRVIYRTP
jgi:hypothetical protein